MISDEVGLCHFSLELPVVKTVMKMNELHFNIHFTNNHITQFCSIFFNINMDL